MAERGDRKGEAEAEAKADPFAHAALPAAAAVLRVLDDPHTLMRRMIVGRMLATPVSRRPPQRRGPPRPGER